MPAQPTWHEMQWSKSGHMDCQKQKDQTNHRWNTWTADSNMYFKQMHVYRNIKKYIYNIYTNTSLSSHVQYSNKQNKQTCAVPRAPAAMEPPPVATTVPEPSLPKGMG